MLNQKNNIKRLCSFLVSEIHLVTMILPYIVKKLKDNINIVTILEKDLTTDIKLLTSRLNIKEEEKEKINKINWKCAKLCRNKKIGKNIYLNNMKENIIIVCGNKDYIDLANNVIEKLKTMQINKITIINCYEVMQFNNNVKEILDKHDKILNTSGEMEIEKVFEGYVKKIV